MKKPAWLFLIIIFSLIPLWDLFHPGLPLTHDGQEHVARTASFYMALKQGQIIPRWAGNLNWGYGHPLFIFFYPLPYFLGSFFHFLGFSLVLATKLVYGLSFTLSGLFAFLWLRQIWGAWPGFAGALFYMFAPYRFVDLYVRGSIGECWAFVWPPLFAYFVFKLAKNPKWKYLLGGSLSLTALILSHNALSLIFLPFLMSYSLLVILGLSKKERVKGIFLYCLMYLFGFGVSAFFWFPALFEAKYTLRDIVTKGNITGFEGLGRLFWSKWAYGGSGSFSVQLGVWQWLVFFLSPLAILKLRQKKTGCWRLIGLGLAFFLLGILMVLPISQVLYLKISFLQKFQFAWRFLSLPVFLVSILAGSLFFALSSRARKVFGLIAAVGLLLANFSYWQAKDFLYFSDSFFKRDYESSTNDTGETAPIWSIRRMEEFPGGAYEVIEGEAEVKPVSRSFTKHEFEVKASGKARVVDNTLYFPGWQVLVDGRPIEIEFQDPAYRGLMTFWVPAGEHQVVVQFGETKLRLFADFISLGSILALCASGIIIKRYYNR